ncbi:hypothetical protein SETIT_6G080500v2 [Setaria italica]|uniref:Uncharacterized protein n=1 Tax=Setaria italica TaxID=4555 RepID=A0A368RJ93_SETIT|nr:hypothetical protein SETIT_6G080500v2 [Setaria italica]
MTDGSYPFSAIIRAGSSLGFGDSAGLNGAQGGGGGVGCGSRCTPSRLLHNLTCPHRVLVPLLVAAPSTWWQRLHRALSLPLSSVKRVKCSHTADGGAMSRRGRFRPWALSPSAMVD